MRSGLLTPLGGIALAAAGPALAGNGENNGNAGGIVCTPNPALGVEPGRPGEVIQDLRAVLPGDLTPPEVADLAGYASVGDAINSDCSTPNGNPGGPDEAGADGRGTEIP